MCQNITLLATSGQEYWVGQCEHGTIHVMWGNTAFLWSPQLMETTTRFVNKSYTAVVVNKQTELVEDMFAMLVSERKSHVQIWFNGVGLYLTNTQFLNFNRLLTDALTKMLPAEHFYSDVAQDEDLATGFQTQLIK